MTRGVKILEYNIAVTGSRERKTLEVLDCSGTSFAYEVRKCEWTLLRPETWCKTTLYSRTHASTVFVL